MQHSTVIKINLISFDTDEDGFDHEAFKEFKATIKATSAGNIVQTQEGMTLLQTATRCGLYNHVGCLLEKDGKKTESFTDYSVALHQS